MAMAELSISISFRAYHGTFQKRESTFLIRVQYFGKLINGFVNNMDSVSCSKALIRISSSFQNQDIDNIVGRATCENIAMYFFEHLCPKPDRVSVSENNEISACLSKDDYLEIPYDSYLFLQKGVRYMVRGELESAEQSFTKSIAFCNENYQAYLLRSRVYRMIDRLQKALEDGLVTIRLVPNWSEGWRNCGNIYMFLGDYSNGLICFNKAVELAPNSALCINNRGYLKFIIGDYISAIDDHSKAIQLNNNYKEAYLDRAEAYIKLGKTDLALQDKLQADTIDEEACSNILGDDMSW